jgi:hypothetical protein
MFEPFSVDDLIETCDKMGVVIELQVFNTVLKQADGKVVILPNGKIQSEGLTNYSKSPALRVDLVWQPFVVRTMVQGDNGVGSAANGVVTAQGFNAH